MLFFIQTTYFTPINLKKYGFKEIDENTLILEKDNSIWKSIYLYDLGWGKERGYYREPMPLKEALFEMAFPDTFQNNGDGNFNYWGSLSVLILPSDNGMIIKSAIYTAGTRYANTFSVISFALSDFDLIIA